MHKFDPEQCLQISVEYLQKLTFLIYMNKTEISYTEKVIFPLHYS